MDIDILDNAVNECKNPYQRTILRKGIDIKSSIYIIFEIESNIEIGNLKLAIIEEYQITRTFL